MFKINKLEAVFLPEEQAEEMEDWIANMEAQGFVIYDKYAPICMRIRMAPQEMVDAKREKDQINNERWAYIQYETL